jgi:hypothetical protein
MLTRRKFLKSLCYVATVGTIAPAALANFKPVRMWKADPAAGQWVEIDVRRPLELRPISGDEPLTFGEEELRFETVRIWQSA